MKILLYTYLVILVTGTIVCLLNLRKADDASKVIAILLGFTTLTELSGHYLNETRANNGFLYTFFNPVQFFLVSLYFNKTVDSFNKHNYGLKIGIAGVLLGILNYFIWPEQENTNTYFLLFESVSITGMCLYAFYRILLGDDGLRLISYSHFWFTAILFFFWSVSFLYWGLRDLIIKELPEYLYLIGSVVFSINILCYSAMISVFLIFLKRPS